jgi:hypothetical protein
MLVQVYGDTAMKKTAVYKWVTRFSKGRDSVTDEERSGRPATSRTEENIAKVHQIVHENHQLTARSIAGQANIDRETVRKILTEDLDMRKVCAKMAPKEHCVSIRDGCDVCYIELQKDSCFEKHHSQDNLPVVYDKAEAIMHKSVNA